MRRRWLLPTRTCEQVTRQHSRTFSLASGLLPPDKRRAARALYAFCRTSDDLIDKVKEGNLAKPGGVALLRPIAAARR